MNSSVNGLDTAFASRFVIWIEWVLPFMEATYLLHNVLPRLSTLVVITFQSCFSGGKFTFSEGQFYIWPIYISFNQYNLA